MRRSRWLQFTVEQFPYLWPTHGIVTPVASTGLYEIQAFSFGPNCIACQFHPEGGGPGFERWLIGHAAELAHSGIDNQRA